MTGGWRLRPAGLGDLAAIVAIIRAEDLRYRGRAEIELATAREQIAADPGFDVDRDLLIAEIDGEAVGSAVINPRGATLAIHPDHDHDHRLDALRGELLSWAEGRQRELLRRPFRVPVSVANVPAVATLITAGYEVERLHRSMIRDFTVTGPPGPVEVPAGYDIRPVDPLADARALHGVDDRAFRQRADYLAETPEEYRQRHIAAVTFAPGWSLIAETREGEAAGSVIGMLRPTPETGYIAIVAVDPAHQRRGLARGLLQAAFDGIHRAGLSKAELHVASDNPWALDLYTGVGMEESERFAHYVRTP